MAAVLFDLDDTLFAQLSGWRGRGVPVADAALRFGVPRAPLVAALARWPPRGPTEAASSTERWRRRPPGRARRTAGGGVRVLPALRLRPYPGSPGCWEPADAGPHRVRHGREPGDPAGKLQPLGLADSFDVVVLSDELGREHRKPDPLPFHGLPVRSGRRARRCHVGDRPAKDVAGALAAGMRPVRVRTGEYAGWPDRPRPWRTAPDVMGAVSLLVPARATEVDPRGVVRESDPEVRHELLATVSDTAAVPPTMVMPENRF